MSDRMTAQHAGEPTMQTPAQQNSPSLGTIVGDIAGDLSTLVRKETELAKLEMREEVKRASKAGALFGTAGAGGLLATLFLSLALMYALNDLIDMSLGWAAFVVGVLWAVIAAISFSVARARMKEIDPVPHQTIATLKEGLS